MKVTFAVNGDTLALDVDPGEVLLDTLREHGYMGVKAGCRSGNCGTCTVLLDGKPVPSCTLLTARIDGRSVTTIEGLGDAGHPHPIQAEFLARGSAQCAYCMQGMMLSAAALLDENPHPTDTEIRDGLSGNLCRCTGYVKAVEAVTAVASGTGTACGSEPASGAAAASPDTGDVGSGDEDNTAVGRRVAKVEGLGLVSGRARYTDDFVRPGMLYGHIKGSPHAHARIVSIDTSKATALDGVECVLTHADVPRVPFSTAGQNCPEPSPYDAVMLDTKVRYIGDRVAVVAATSHELAKRACDLIEVEYDVLPAVLDPADAMKPGAPVIHDEKDAEGIEDASRNLAGVVEAEVGDVEQGLAAADRIFDNTYEVQYVQGTPTEPHITMCYLDEKDRLVVVTSTQVPFHARRIVARVNGIPLHTVRVIKPRIGGAFGAKQEIVLEDVCAALTLRTRRPVKMRLDRGEELAASRTRHPQRIRMRTGVNEDGTLTAIEMTSLVNTGAYGSHSTTVPSNTGSKSLPLYRAPNLRFRADAVYTNLPIAGALRGYGAPQGFFALETQIEEIALALGRDPIEFRLANAIREGDADPIAEHLGEGKAGFRRIIRTNGLPECWRRVCDESGWDAWHEALPAGQNWSQGSKPYLRRAMGASFAMHGSGIPGDDMGAATVRANEDGSFHLMIGATDLGTGSDTILSQMVAEVLGVTTDKVVVYSSDTDKTPFDVGAYASSTTYITGQAVIRASEQVRDRLLYHAARMMGVDASELTCERGEVRAASGRTLPLAEVASEAMYGEEKEHISFSASNMTFDCPPPFAAACADIEVDMETGRVDVLDFTCAIDLGHAINPTFSEGQIQGGVAMGLGYALSEEMLFDENGRMTNADLLDYKIFSALDTPAIKAILVRTDEPTGPFGAKSVSEIPVDVVAPAVGNALYYATGARLRRTPFTPERVLAGIRALDE